MSEDFLLQRFADAQDEGGTWERAMGELRAGRKRSHWMWFVFPQVAGLGFSPTAQHFAISGLPEAHAYLAHPVLGPRLRQAAHILTELAGADPVRIFGAVDAQKLRSSMTLFAATDQEPADFQAVLDQYFGGTPDEATLERI